MTIIAPAPTPTAPSTVTPVPLVPPPSAIRALSGRPPALPALSDYRCRCGRLKDRAALAPGSAVEWKCQRCAGMNWYLLGTDGVLTHYFQEDTQARGERARDRERDQSYGAFGRGR